MDKKIILEKIFPYLTKDIASKLQIDYESMTYITIPSDTKKINGILEKHIKNYKNIKNCTIVDCTAGAGGDTICFARNFGNVISIEVDSQRYSFLKNNIDAYGFKNVHIINGSCADIVPKINNIDVIYIDPPWGGKNYRNSEKLRLTLDDSQDKITKVIIPIETMIKNFFDVTYMLSVPKLIALKLPKNYDLKYLYDSFNGITDEFDIYMYELKKMFIIIIERK